MQQKQIWHNLSVKEVLVRLKAGERGLSEKEAEKRLAKFGLNKLPEGKRISRFKIFLDQFKSPLIYILVIAAIVTLVLTAYTDALVISIAIFINAIFGAWEENKACRTLEKLKKILKTKAVVLRDRHLKEVWQEKVVIGDIVILSPGSKVPADGRLIEARNLKINEAVLTGEWLAARKNIKTLSKETPLADRDNMVYAGTLVEDGQGKMVVVATGTETETGKVSQILEETEEEETPLKKKLFRFSKTIGKLFIIFCLAIFVGGILRQGSFLEMFEAAIAIAVGGIPEALPITLTVILAIGMERILRKKGLVRRLSSVETLGSTSIICCDKTLTLTQGKMVMSQIITGQDAVSLEEFQSPKADIKDKQTCELALKIASLCNEAYVENPEEALEKWIIRGGPTDRALIEGPLQVGISKSELEKEMPFVALSLIHI
mgnify:CR=1 FL=1